MLDRFRDDVCVLSAMGTAAVINHHYTISDKTKSALKDAELEIMHDLKGLSVQKKHSDTDKPDLDSNKIGVKGCTMCHMSFSKLGLPVTGKMKKCAVCRYVPPKIPLNLNRY